MMSLLPLLIACSSRPSPSTGAETGLGDDTAAAAEIFTPLPAPRLLRRMSLDLRGVLPTAAELDAVEADPALLEDYRAAYLADPLLADRLVFAFQERWHTRIEEFQVEHGSYFLDDADTFPFNRAVGEEPLRLLAHVAASDRPWTDVVTADYAMVDPMLAALWPVERRDPSAEGWSEARWTDSRPPAGVLVSNGMWMRYPTSESNMNRERVAALTRLLLCEDYLERPVSFSRTAGLDQEQTAAALQTEPACMGCHSSIEPMAATLFGFYPGIAYNAFELDTYHPEREPLGPSILGVEPAYFGQPIEGLEELGARIAGDRRFSRCTASSAAETLWRRPVTVDDYDTVEALRQALLDSGFSYRALLAAVMETAEYQAGGLATDAPAAWQDRAVPRRLLPPAVYASAVEAATGFRWIDDDGYDMMDSDTSGFRILAGGVDGELVVSPQLRPGLTWALVVRAAALSAASAAAAHDLSTAEDSEDYLLAGVTAEDVPGDAAFTAALEGAHWRLLAERLEPSDRLVLEEMWLSVAEEEGAEAAWTLLLSALLRGSGLCLILSRRGGWRCRDAGAEGRCSGPGRLRPAARCCRADRLGRGAGRGGGSCSCSATAAGTCSRCSPPCSAPASCRWTTAMSRSRWAGCPW